ncbi:ubiquinone/menaquinone biosynthesis C-methylase UbiE [Streptacidiphilus sp. MAP12-16]|uniref:class I SAM-dependent methyltransferase n=1 Tax=Streptacidiphilus sp. MAP12-16 TaxID=3156300 RepID=UPI003513962E
MIDYNAEADSYDASRGGEARAAAAAQAIERLLPVGMRTLVDVACGTGIVTRRLCRPGRVVLGLDRSPGMATMAVSRLPRSLALADATRLPVGTARTDAVTMIWLLHLLPDAAPVLAEAARALRGGGALVTTVDKDEAAFHVDSDIAGVTAEVRSKHAPAAADQFDQVVSLAAEHGMRPVGEVTFVGVGQGRSPRQWSERIAAGSFPWSRQAAPAELGEICRNLAALPAQDVPRPDPVYRLIALA